MGRTYVFGEGEGGDEWPGLVGPFGRHYFLYEDLIEELKLIKRGNKQMYYLLNGTNEMALAAIK